MSHNPLLILRNSNPMTFSFRYGIFWDSGIEPHLENCFDLDKQIAPISLCIQFEKNTPDILLALINNTSLFIAEVKEYNADNQQTHILLHPAGKNTHVGINNK